jgi:3-methyladenine DNA glycosylase AlkD
MVDTLAKRINDEPRALRDQSVATMRKERRRWSATLRKHSAEDVIEVTLELLERFNHRWIAYELLLFHPSALKLVGPHNVERFAGRLRSWGEVDQFGVLLAGPAWSAGQIDDHTVHAWALRPDRWWRRAALVATVSLNTRSRGGSGDVRRTLAICGILLHDRDDLVIKAMSWALRELIVHGRSSVEAFLVAHDHQLAARVKREVRSKLTTGLKSPSARTRPWDPRSCS